MQRFEAITFVYNEEFLLPFFINHYKDLVDRFNLVYDMDSTDRTLEILQSCPKANIIHFKFPDMMDDKIKVDYINQIYAGISDAWVLNVDADEFIFLDSPPVASVNSVSLYHVFRHVTDRDLDPKLPVAAQRRHGFLEAMYRKPIIVRSGLGFVKWNVGNHSLQGVNTPPAQYIGAHWANADPCFCVKRRVTDRKERQSKFNLQTGMTIQHHNITEEDVLRYCKEHENDPACW